MRKRSFLLLLAVFLVGVSCLHYSCKPKKSCCELPAPNSLIANVISGDSVKLDWSPVAGAAAYRVTVKDITADTTLPLLTTVPDSILLIGLTPDHEYTAIVQAICGAEKGCPVSPNGAAVCFRTIIIEDVVIMKEIGGTGMDNCNCDGGLGYTSISGSSLQLNLSFPNGVTRLIYLFKISQTGGANVSFKLAFDQNCLNNIKFYAGTDCTSSGITASVDSTNSAIEFNQGGSLVGKLTPSISGSTATLTFSGSGYTKEYKSCAGDWTEGCQ